jgi:quinol monooxygenase YgiN
MKHVMVRYTVKEERAAAAEKEIAAFVDAVKRNEPYTSYEVYREGPGSYVHIIGFRSESSEAVHSKAPYTNRFVDFLYPSCVSEPVFTELSLVRSTRAEHAPKW